MRVYNLAGQTVVNAETIAEDVELAATGITFTNTEEGRVLGTLTFTVGGSTLVNEAGGYIGAPQGQDAVSFDAIIGSSGNDRVENSGVIAGLIDLGPGNDTFLSINGSGTYIGTVLGVEMGTGDDLLRLQGASVPFFLHADGGAGHDRLELDTANQVYGTHLLGFEEVVLGQSGNYSEFDGLLAVRGSGGLAELVYFNLVDWQSPAATVHLASGEHWTLQHSAFAAIAASDGNDLLELAGTTQIAAAIALGLGNDALTLSNGARASTIAPSLDGGAGGNDRLSITVQAGGLTETLANVSGFEQLSLFVADGMPALARLSHANGFARINLGSNVSLELQSGALANTVIGGGIGSQITLAAGLTLAGYEYPLVPLQIPDTGLVHPNFQNSTTLTNHGTITGSVIFYDGDDQYLGATGSAGTVYGNAGNDRLEGGAAADNFHGGTGADLLIAGAGGDTLTGGTGGDRFRGTMAEHAGDTITDFALGDRLQISDANPASFTFATAGDVVSFGATALTLSGSDNLHLLSRPISGGGGVEIFASAVRTASDFAQDGFSDILWRNANGAVTFWDGTAMGFDISATGLTFAGPDWSVAAIADITGDGYGDVVWRNANGALALWQGSASGFAPVPMFHAADTAWQIVGAGEFTGDAADDILWRHTDGTLTIWRFANGFFTNSGAFSTTVGTDWQVADTADYNADGHDDILWRNANGAVTVWHGNGSGFTATAPIQPVGLDWQVAGSGDFSGDGVADILWRNANGAVTVWTSGASGFDAGAFAVTPVDPAWEIAAVGFYNDDSLSDILWRHSSGTLTVWNGAGDGFDTSGPLFHAGTDWDVIAP